MAEVLHKHSSIQRLVTDVYQRVPRRLVSVEDAAPDDPYVITFVRSSDGQELCTVRADENEPERYEIIDEEIRVPHCLIQGVVWRVNDGLRKRG
jgi:hypothetical protein